MRRLLVLLRSLPADSALARAADDDGGPARLATVEEGKAIFRRIGG